MELPTPKNADTPKQKKHREQLIVAGTLVLVLLTFMLVMRRGEDSSGVTSDSSGFTPSDSGGGSGSQDLGALPLMVGSIPGQVDAMEAGRFAALQRRLTRLSKQNQRIIARERRMQRELRAQHPHAHKHPQGPAHEVHKSHHVPMSGGVLHGHPQPHPPQHHAHRKEQRARLHP